MDLITVREIYKNREDFLEKEIKGEPPVKGNKGNCANCRYPGCRYNGLKPEELPGWMKKKGIEK